MPTLKELTQKIASLRNTQKMTKTMKLVSGSKMRRALAAQQNAQAYGQEMGSLLANISARVESAAHPLMESRAAVRKAHAVVITSDRGLCGGFNNNLVRFAARWVEAEGARVPSLDFSFCGRRGYGYFRTRCNVLRHYEGVTDRPDYARARTVADELMAQYMGGQYDEIYLIHNQYRSALSQVPTASLLLPITNRAGASGATGRAGAAGGGMLMEPAEDQLLGLLLPEAIRFGVFSALLENAAGEHAARMTAMESASKNAKDMIERYTLVRNRARQAAITKELIEIVTGAESL